MQNERDRLEITPAMIEAGARVLESYEPYGLINAEAKSRAIEIFSAMALAMSASPQRLHSSPAKMP